MRISHYLLVTAGVLLLSACEKNVSMPEPVPETNALIADEHQIQPVKLLTKSTITSSYKGTTVEFYYKYNKQKQLDSIINKTSNNDIFSIKCFFYDDNDNLIKTEENTNNGYKSYESLNT